VIFDKEKKKKLEGKRKRRRRRRKKGSDANCKFGEQTRKKHRRTNIDYQTSDLNK